MGLLFAVIFNQAKGRSQPSRQLEPGVYLVRNTQPRADLSTQRARIAAVWSFEPSLTAQSTKRGAILSKQANYLRKTEAMFAA